ncbi:hypothetical protein DFH06DRAFT_130255 [Mycena polygramma]|nr:hypothetical protein DFH06DRAFT_130255 [Mycena polygramma]
MKCPKRRRTCRSEPRRGLRSEREFVRSEGNLFRDGFTGLQQRGVRSSSLGFLFYRRDGEIVSWSIYEKSNSVYLYLYISPPIRQQQDFGKTYIIHLPGIHCSEEIFQPPCLSARGHGCFICMGGCAGIAAPFAGAAGVRPLINGSLSDSSSS